jgi:hypothetical protein
LRDIGIDPHTLYPHVRPRPPALFDHVKTQFIEDPPSTPFLKKVASIFQSSRSKKKALQTDAEKRSSQSSFTSEEDEELRDALTPKFDQLMIKRSWWILEILPVSIRYQKGDDQWTSYIGYVNLVSLVYVNLKPFK